MISATRHQQLLSGMNSTAKKVYDAVPHREEWNAQTVLAQLARAGMSTTVVVVAGCLGNLAQAGLIRQGAKGFQRIEVRTPKKVGLDSLKDAMQDAQKTYQQLQQEPQMTTNPPPVPATNIVDHIGNLAQRMNAMAQRHSQELLELAQRQRAEREELAHLVSDAAIEVQGQLETNEADLTKYRQLQTLLKGMGG